MVVLRNTLRPVLQPVLRDVLVGFLPTDLTGLQLWLDAADTSTITESGNAVSQWDDKSGNGFDVTQVVGANQPETMVSTIGGLNALKFDGDDDVLNNTSFIDFSTITIFVIAEYEAGGDVNQALVDINSGATNTGIMVYREVSSSKLRIFDPGQKNIIIPESVPITHIFTATVSLFSTTYHIDGVLMGEISSNTLTNTLNRVDIGQLAELAVFTLKGSIGEVIVYDRAVSFSERNQVEAYLSKKWQIGLFQPSSLAGLKLWLDAADSSTITESGNFISQWLDKSGNGNDAVQTTGSKQPLTNTNTIGVLNAITYDGADDELVISSHSSIDNIFGAAGEAGGSVYCVVNPFSSGQIFDKGLITLQAVADQGSESGKIEYDISLDFSIVNGFFSTNTSDTTLGVGNILGTLYDNSLPANTPEFRINGTDVVPGIVVTPSGTAESDAGLDLFIGISFNGALPLDCYFGELVMYDRILTAEEEEQLESYFSNKWFIPLSFPFVFSGDFSSDFS